MKNEHFIGLRRKLLWFDCAAGLSVGAGVLLLHGLLSRWYGLPRGLVLFLGLMNVLYGTYALSLARRKRRTLKLVRILALGNMVWAGVCALLVITFRNTASPVGLGLLLIEGIFVGGLGLLEWRSRQLLIKEVEV